MAEEKKQESCPSEGCAGCAHASTCTSQKKDFRKPANPYSAVRKVIGVISGKGGVGKSMVTASLARMMIEKGYTAGILMQISQGHRSRRCMESMSRPLK